MFADSSILDEHGRAPVDAKLLRNHAYPLRTDIRYTHVERWFDELESTGIVTVYESRSRSFALSEANHPHQHPFPQETSAPEVFGVIHKSGADPPNLDQINSAVAAAAAFNDLDLLFEVMRNFFPHLDLKAEHRKYFRHQQAKKKPTVAVHLHNRKMLTFVKWCLQSAVPMPPPPPVRRVADRVVVPMPDLDDEQRDFITEDAHKRFLAELEARKLRKNNNQKGENEKTKTMVEETVRWPSCQR